MPDDGGIPSISTIDRPFDSSCTANILSRSSAFFLSSSYLNILSLGCCKRSTSLFASELVITAVASVSLPFRPATSLFILVYSNDLVRKLSAELTYAESSDLTNICTFSATLIQTMLIARPTYNFYTISKVGDIYYHMHYFLRRLHIYIHPKTIIHSQYI